jgi:hypothetical protein
MCQNIPQLQNFTPRVAVDLRSLTLFPDHQGRGSRIMERSKEFPDQWSEARRSDLEDALGVIVSLPAPREEGAPAELYQWYFVNSPEFQDFEAAFTEAVRQALIEAYAPVLPPQALDQLEARPYSVGPAAQEWPKYLYLLEHVWAAAQVVSTLVDVGEAAQFAMELFRKALHRLGFNPESPSAPRLGFTQKNLEGLCASYVREHFHPRAQLSTSTEVSPSAYGSAGHPGGGERYRVAVRAGRQEYIFDIDTWATVSGLFRRERAQETSLPWCGWHKKASPRD